MKKIMSGKISRKMFLSFGMIICIQVIILWIISMYYMNKNLKMDEVETAEYAANQAFNELEQIFSQTSELLNIIQNMDYVNNIVANSRSGQAYDQLLFSKDFTNHINIKSVVTDGFIYVPQNDLIISTFTMWESLDSFLKYDFVSEDLISQDEFEEYLVNGKGYLLLAGEVNYSSENRSGFLYIVPVANYFGVEQVPKIGVWIDMDVIISEVLNMLPEDSQIIMSVNENTVVCAYDEDLLVEEFFDENVSDNDVYYFEEIINGNIASQIIIQQGELRENINQIQLIMVIILMICMLVDFILVYIFSIINTRPIKQIQEALSIDDTNISERGELVSIVTEIGELVKKEKQLLEQTDIASYLIEEHYIWKLITGNDVGNGDDFERELAIANIYFPYRYFLSCIIIYHKTSQELRELVMDITTYQCKCYISHESEKELSLLLNCESETEKKRYLRELQGVLVRNNVHFNIGVGTCVEELELIHRSYKESQHAFEHKIAGTNNNILYFQENIGNQEFVFSTEDENQLMILINSSKSEEARSLITRIANDNLKMKLNINIMRQLYVHIFISLMKACKNNRDIIREKYSLGLLNGIRESNEMLRQVHKLADEICIQNQLHDKDKIKSNTIIDRTLEYLDEHYMESDLNLTQVADELGVHKVYLSSTFNESLNCGFVEYVNKKRVERASLLLMNKSCKLSDVSNDSGFGSEATFRREFKKYMGLSPKQYKDMQE